MTSIQNHQRKRRRPILPAMVWAFLSILLFCSISAVLALPEGFVIEKIVNPSKDTATMGAFAPNLRSSDKRPMMLLASKEGRVHVLESLENPNETSLLNDTEQEDGTLVLDLYDNLCLNGQRGLISMAVHPNFVKTRWVYLYYTRWREGCLEDAFLGPQNILVRYTMNATTLALENEQVLMEFGILETRIRNGGAMAFGTDGLLYLATGDGGVRQNAQNRQNLYGKLLRLGDDGRVPVDNPFADIGFPCGKSDGVIPDQFGFLPNAVYCSEIYSWGLRNPVNLALNPQQSDASTVLFSISDVGAEAFEELSWAGTDFEAKNYGWPIREGPCALSTQLPHCTRPLSDSNLVDPFHYYSRTGGGRLAGSAFVPDRTWPNEYKYLVLDLELQTISNLMEDPSAECRESCFPPTSGFVNTTFYEPMLEEWTSDEYVVGMFFGPYKDTRALYVIQDGNTNSILRIRYTSSKPVAVIEVGNIQQRDGNDTTGSLPISSHSSQDLVSPNHLTVGDTVWLDGNKSFDPEGGELIFQWDFGDSIESRTNSSNPSHVYDTPGEYTVILVVTNSKDQAQMTTTTVVVEKSPYPTAVMLSPVEGDLLKVGEALRLKAEAYDTEGNNIPDDQMTWSVRQYHSNGFDFLLDETSGNDFELNPFPELEDFVSSETIFLRVVLYVTDNNGLMTEVVTDVHPNIVTIDLVTQPEGLEFRVGDNELTAPTQIQSSFDQMVQINPEQPPYKFLQWSDGNTDLSRAIPRPTQQANNTRIRDTNIPAVTVEAIFCLVDNAPCRYATTSSCCSGFCDEKGFCRNDSQNTMIIDATLFVGQSSMEQDHVSVSTPEEEDVKSRPISNPNATNFVADDIAMSQANGNNNLDLGSTGRENNYAYGVTPSWKYFICLSMAFLLVSLFYFACKYFRLKKKLKASKKSSRSNFQDKSKRTKSAKITSGGIENTSTCDVDSISYDSLSSASTAIWNKLTEETERRGKLRSKYSFDVEEASTTPKTPETLQTRESPSNVDPDASPSSTLTSNIDETLVRLDDLLTKCFTRKSTLSCRKVDECNDSAEEDTSEVHDFESGLSNAGVIEPSENNGLALIGLTPNENTTAGSPLRERNEESLIEATFSMSSIYSTGSFQDESHALHLPDVSLASANQSLLIFQDVDLSTSKQVSSSANESDLYNSLMEPGVARDGEKTASSSDSTNSDTRELSMGHSDSLAGGEDEIAENDLSGLYENHLLGNAEDVLSGLSGDETSKNDFEILNEVNVSEETEDGHVPDDVVVVDGIMRSDSGSGTNMSERQMLIKRVNDLISAWADSDSQ